MSNINYRWIEGRDASEEEWGRIESILASRGWMSLNRPTSRILVAEDADGKLLGFFVYQWLPYCGPMFVIPSARGGDIPKDLANRMLEFLVEANARGWTIAADSPHAAKLCEEFGMTLLKSHLYVMPNPGGVEI